MTLKTVRDILGFINTYDSFIITTHTGPDADGIGAEIIMYHLLKTMQKRVHVINADPVPIRFAFLDPDGIIEHWDSSRHFHLPELGGIIIVDTSDEFNLGCMLDEALPHAQGVYIIDHHEQSPFTHLDGYIDASAASTTQILIDLVQAADLPITKDVAIPAYAGLLYDTGSFIYSKTTAKTFETALLLVQSGAIPHEIYRDLFESNSISVLLLQKRVLSSLEILGNGSLAVQVMTKKDLEETNASYEDAENFINIPLQIKEIEVSILIKQNREGLVRCSLRSKGKVNVSLLAQQFNGGGHKMAAGFKSSLGLEETRTMVIQKVLAALGMA
ncbi:DHH family phosphoesterase [Gracilinema caldarium]|uniref:Phosphoesterase RecJ domain protein n=1 Tax=Gracilinema caldarium (strain ATCC 51460 / DSM 7334 / H1) TaxID=744872 RepID=F8F0E2_GRAC1|nr:bifunctional oligoribonuclease/PAP phosphatase NrnA [Gracilinema caldarium]AEJ19286.1 phosphoesterase RecJ domain protein [Gracilinema caldarium DSM 7334]